MINEIVLWAVIGLMAVYAYLKYSEARPVHVNRYNKEIHDVLNNEEYKVKGRFD